jgi:ATP-dependent RNA helicase DHX29
LSTKRKLLDIRPELFVSKKGKRGIKSNVESSGQTSVITRKLQAKLSKIEQDILFDQRAADYQWDHQRELLLRERFARKEFGLEKEADGAEGSTKMQFENDLGGNHPDKASTVEDESSIQTSDDELLGPMFSVMSVDQDPSASQKDGDIGIVRLRDFGEHKGLGPTKVLKDVLRAR